MEVLTPPKSANAGSTPVEDAKLTYWYDDNRHLICTPYSIDNLHRMAQDLGIPRHWYHKGRLPHYDIPIMMLDRIPNQAYNTDTRTIVWIIKSHLEESKHVNKG